MRWVAKTSEKLFRLSFSTDRSSRKSQVFRLDPVGKLSRKKVESKKPFFDCVRKLDLGFSRKRLKNLTFRLDLSVEKLSRKSFSPVFSTHRIAHPTTKHTPTCPHTHTMYHTAVSYNSADAALAITAVASRRKPAWRTPSSARQQRVSYDSSSARYRCHFANNGYACCSFGGSRLSATPRT